MKQLLITVAIVFLACAFALAWPRTIGPLLAVHYTFEQKDIAALRTTDKRLVIGLISDIHFRRTPRDEITGSEQTIKILGEFMRSMNEVVKPDLIIQLGDSVDARRDDTKSPFTEDVIFDRIRSVKKWTSDKTEIPWFNVVGNHEYMRPIFSGDAGRFLSKVESAWKDESNTWYFKDVKGFRLIFLNTAIRQTDSRAHKIPNEEMKWLSRVLSNDNLPTFVFMHVPVTGGDGSKYDTAINREKVMDLLSGYDLFVAGFFGHSHHDDAWDGLRVQFDKKGNPYYHVTAPHQWMGDADQHPWVVVTVDGGKKEMTVETGSAVSRSKSRETLIFLQEYIEKTYQKILRIIRG